MKDHLGETGYCTERDCVDDRSCVNHGLDDAEMCCVNVDSVEDPYRICLKTAPGAACGDQTRACGRFCAGGLGSMCEPGLDCLASGPDDPNAICSCGCERDSDCSACEPDEPDICGCDSFTCQPIAGGQLRCLQIMCDCCFSSLDCEGGGVCAPWPNEDQTRMVGQCIQVGALPSGSECDYGEGDNPPDYSDRCAGYYCFDGLCSEVCELDSDCPGEMVCLLTEFQMDELGTMAVIGMCRRPE